MECISIEPIFALTQNRLPAGEAERIRTHLDTGCTACRNQWCPLQEVLAATAGHTLLQPPAWLTRQAMGLFTWNKTRSPENGLQRIPALLLVDSFAEGQLVGFRSASLMARQMLYRAGNYNINLSLNYLERMRAIDIIGQPMPLCADLEILAGADVEMLKNSIVTCATKSNEFGAFILSGIPEGIYDLRVKSEKEQLDIVELDATVRRH
ncbi:MAG: hypothetical protein HY314_05620 [Acidobacteria bacterium]|nr:hypothetical protein [Acidobacteriota bacterium]